MGLLKELVMTLCDLMKTMISKFVPIGLVTGLMILMILMMALSFKSCERYIDVRHANIEVYNYNVQVVDGAGTAVKTYNVKAANFYDEKRYVEFTDKTNDVVLHISKDSNHSIIIENKGVVK